MRREPKKRIVYPEYASIARAITQRRQELGYKIQEIARAYKYLRYNTPKSTEGYLQRVERGAIYGTFTKHAWSPRTGVSLRREQLERLARLLYLLHIEPEERIIDLIKNRDRRFLYPPEQKKQLPTKNLEKRVQEVTPQEELEQEIQVLLQKKREEQQWTTKSLAKRLQKKLGLNQESTYDYIKRVLSGKINGRQQPSKKTLERAAHIFKEVQIAEDDAIIARIQEYYPDFRYSGDKQG